MSLNSESLPARRRKSNKKSKPRKKGREINVAPATRTLRVSTIQKRSMLEFEQGSERLDSNKSDDEPPEKRRRMTHGDTGGDSSNSDRDSRTSEGEQNEDAERKERESEQNVARRGQESGRMGDSFQLTRSRPRSVRGQIFTPTVAMSPMVMGMLDDPIVPFRLRHV